MMIAEHTLSSETKAWICVCKNASLYSLYTTQHFESRTPMFKSSHIYLYSTFYNTGCIKAASQW